MSHKLEQLEFKLEKIIGIQKHAGKVRKSTIGQRLSQNLIIIVECQNPTIEKTNSGIVKTYTKWAEKQRLHAGFKKMYV